MAANPDKLRKEAQRHTAKGRYEHAIGCYQELLKLDPTDAKLWVNVGDLVSKLGHTGQAVQVYAKAANQFALTGELARAISINKLILELDPKHRATQARLQELMQRAAADRAAATPAETPPPPQRRRPDPVPDPGGGDGGAGGNEWHTPIQVDFSDDEEDESPMGTDVGFEPGGEEDGGDFISFNDGGDPAGAPAEPSFEIGGDGEVEGGLELDGSAGDAVHTIMQQPSPHMDDPEALNRAVASLPEMPLFAELDAQAFEGILHSMFLLHFGPGDAILQEGDLSDSFYVLAAGTARVVKEAPDGSIVDLATLGPGDFFGEFAFLTGTPRSASIYANDDETEVLEFSREALAELSTAHPVVNQVLERFYRRRLVGTLLKISPIFQPLPADKREQILKHFEPVTVEAGTAIIEQGQEPGGFYVIVSGAVAVSATEAGGEAELATLKEGDILGEISLLTGKPANATCTAIDETRMYRLDGNLFRRFLKSFPEVHAAVKGIAKERLAARKTALSNADERGRAGLV